MWSLAKCSGCKPNLYVNSEAEHTFRKSVRQLHNKKYADSLIFNRSNGKLNTYIFCICPCEIVALYQPLGMCKKTKHFKLNNYVKAVCGKLTEML